MGAVDTSQARSLYRQKIDKEIQDAIKIVHILISRRNALAHISLLPTEILSRIFITLAYSCLYSSDLSWIRSVTAICTHWRAIALGCPNLWSFIVFSRPIWVEEMLDRSKMVPLIIKADVPGPIPNQIDAIHLALQHFPRIRELRLAASLDGMEKLLNPIDKPAPLLQSLCLSLSEFNHRTDRYTLPEKLFVGDSHHLQRLELTHCNISCESPLLCGLVHLKLYETFNVQPTMMQLLDALEKMPLLQTLDLTCEFPSASNASPEIKRVVHLSHLTSLRLTSTTLERVYFLNHISYPATTSLALFCELDNSTVIDAISSVWNGKDGSILLRALLIDDRSILCSNLKGWTASRRTDEYPSEPAQIDLRLQWFDLNPKTIIDVRNALALTNLRTLFVYCKFSKATWLNAFGHLTSLRSIHVHGPSAFAFISALSIGSENSQMGNDTKEIFLPGLHGIWLEGACFEDPHDFFNNLQDCLMSRCHWNVEVRELHLLGCYQLDRDQVELLKEIVVDVDWVQEESEDEREDDE
jgi:hypothetical protein